LATFAPTYYLCQFNIMVNGFLLLPALQHNWLEILYVPTVNFEIDTTYHNQESYTMKNELASSTVNLNSKLALSLSLALTAIALLFTFPVWAALVNTQLNTGTANSITGIGITPAIVSDDGQWVVYIAEETAGKRELFSVSIDGGTPVKLNPALGADDDIFVPHVVSADSQWVVFNVRGNANAGPDRVYSVPIDGSSAATPLHPVLGSGQLISEVSITPDSSRVIIRGELDTDNAVELYSVPIDGSSSTPTKLHPDYPAGRFVQSSYLISSDSQTIIYRADQDIDNALDLYSTRTDGSTSSDPTRLTATAATTQNWVSSYHISNDSSRVIYTGDLEEDNTTELYSVEVDGTNHVKLHADLSGTGKDVISNRIAISDDSSTVVFIANLDTTTDNELYRIPITGGSPTKLNGTLASTGDVNNFVISPDSSTVIYQASQDNASRVELYSTPIGSSSSLRLNTALNADGKNVTDFIISDDSSTVVYRADQTTDELFELYSTPIDSSNPVKLNGTLAGGEGVSQYGSSTTGYLITPDSSRVVYRATQDSASTEELYMTPVNTSDPIKLNGTLTGGGNVDDNFWLDSGGTIVVYVADQTSDSDNDLYASYLTSELALTKTVELTNNPPSPGEAITYTIVLTNSGDGIATDVVVQDSLPAGINGTDLDQTVTVAAGESLTFTLAATIASDAGYGVTILNTASYSHTSSSGNDTAGFTTTTDTTPPVFEAGALITPTNGISLTNTRPTFDWDDATDSQSGVISYTLLITTSNDSLSVQQATTTVTTTDSNFTPSVDLASGVYTWTVRAHDAEGNASDYISPAATFEIEMGASSSSVSVYLPVVVKDN